MEEVSPGLRALVSVRASAVAMSVPAAVLACTSAGIDLTPGGGGSGTAESTMAAQNRTRGKAAARHFVARPSRRSTEESLPVP